MRLPSFAYHAPDTLDKALLLKRELGANAAILAGGTDLIVNLKHRLSAPVAMISLKNIKSLKGVAVSADSLILAAGTWLNDVATDTSVLRHFPILAKAVGSVGALSIQHYRGTIGGNLCLTPRCLFYNQSLFWRTGKGTCHRTGGKDCLAAKGSESCQAICSSDTVPVLVSLSAQLTVAGSGGTRIAPIADFFTGKGESPFKLAPDEIVTGIRLPIPWGKHSWSYQRLSFRSAVDFPLMNCAAVAIVDGGKVESFKITLSAAGPAPIPLREMEAQVKGQKPEPEMILRAQQIAIKAAEGVVVENASASRDYRVQMAGVLAGRAVKEALSL